MDTKNNAQPMTAEEIADLAADRAAHAASRGSADALAVIDRRLAAIDVEAIRPLRAIAIGAGTQFDTDKLAALEAEAAALRAERAGLV